MSTQIIPHLAEYFSALESKAQLKSFEGFSPTFMPSCMFDFQAHLADWNCWAGSSADFADCGLGKTLIQEVWAENVVRHTNKPVLIMTPLAVAGQSVTEGEKFGIDCRRSSDGRVPHKGVVITNYERLHHFDPNDFAGAVCDESSILKNFAGVRRSQITEFMRRMKYRLLCTATAAPNDFTELGTSSEALGYLGHMDMLNRFFKNDMNNSATGRMYGEVVKWRFKGHAEELFWKWVCSWARSVRKPSDLGFDDGKFILPELMEREHIVEASTLADGMLFPTVAANMRDQRDESKRSIEDRCRRVCELVDDQQSLIWCHLNPEGDMLEEMIPNAVQVSGKDSDEAKEEKFLAFASGQIRNLVTKHKIGAWGLNFQNCAHVIGFPSHSFEQYYQGVRRCWRFGQTRPVVSDIVMTEGYRAVMENQKRKQAQTEEMFARIVENMKQAIGINKSREFTVPTEVPSWL